MKTLLKHASILIFVLAIPQTNAGNFWREANKVVKKVTKESVNVASALVGATARSSSDGHPMGNDPAPGSSNTPPPKPSVPPSLNIPNANPPALAPTPQPNTLVAAKETYPDGKLKVNGFKDAATQKKETTWTYYREDGKKEYEGTYKNDLKEGTWTYWDPSGQVLRTEVWAGGKLTSPAATATAELKTP